MTRAEVQRVLVDALCEALESAGQTVPDISDQIRPFCDLPGLDSITAVEIELTLTERLGREIKDVLVPGRSRSDALTVAQITEQLCEIVPVEGATNG